MLIWIWRDVTHVRVVVAIHSTVGQVHHEVCLGRQRLPQCRHSPSLLPFRLWFRHVDVDPSRIRAIRELRGTSAIFRTTVVILMNHQVHLEFDPKDIPMESIFRETCFS